MIIKTARRKAAATALSFSTLLALTACGGEPAVSDAEKPSAKGSEPAAPTQPAVAGFPVGEPFGEAAWSVDVGKGESTVTVRPDRIIVDRSFREDLEDRRMLQVYTPDGKEAWTYDLSDHKYPANIPVEVLEKTVAILRKDEVEGSGLDKAKKVTKVILLSQQDGSVVAEVEVPTQGVSVGEFGNVIFQGDGGINFVTEDGKVMEVKGDIRGNGHGGLAGGVPFWTNRSNDLVTKAGTLGGFPGIADSEIANMKVLAVANKLGLIVVRVVHGATAESADYAVRPGTGEVVYKVDCADRSLSGDNNSRVARNSPSGKYAIHGSMRLTATEGRCYGGGDGQKKIWLTVVGDNGTAYGEARASARAEGELVTIPVTGEPKVSKLLNGAPVPSGIMNGGLVVHLDKTTLTGNPVK